MPIVVKLRDLIDIMGGSGKNAYLNRRTGECIRIDKWNLRDAKSSKSLEEFKEWERPRIKKIREYLNAKEGDWLLLPINPEKHIKWSFGNSLDDEDIGVKIKSAAQHDPHKGVDRFHDMVVTYGVDEDYAAFYDKELGEIAADWCEDNGISYVDEEGIIAPRVKQGAAVSDLIQALGDEGFEKRRSAARALGRLGPEAADAVADLIGYLAEDSEFKYVAGKALAEIGSITVPALIQALESGDSQIRDGAAYTLSKIGPEAASAAPALIEALWDADSKTGHTAAKALGQIGPLTGVVPALIQVITDHTYRDLRPNAIRALGEFGSAAASAVPALTRLYESSDRFHARLAIQTLHKIGPEKGVIPTLTEAALRDDDSAIYDSAIRALKDFAQRTSETIPALIQIVAEGDSLRAMRAHSALIDIAEEIDAMTDFKKDRRNIPVSATAWQQWWEEIQEQGLNHEYHKRSRM